MNQTLEALGSEIEAHFPFTKRPQPSEVVQHQESCSVCADILIEMRGLSDGVAIGGSFIRAIHQNLSHFTPMGWRWLLPHYLRYCLTDEAAINCFETEFFVYNLAPSSRFEQSTREKLALLDKQQVTVLRSFLRMLRQTEYWSSNHLADLMKGEQFLERILNDS